MAQKVRVAGGFTAFHWSENGRHDHVIAFADEVRVTGVTPVAEPEVIQPMNALRPVEIVTPRAHKEGRITLVLKELYNETVWARLAGLADSRDIIDIFEHVAALENGIRITKWIRTPRGADYSETYEQCVVARIMDDEPSIRIDTMSVNKEVELWFTHARKSYPGLGSKPSRPAIFS